jgi:alkylation response protein AidB-like acyl-CoA dehydrogenase
VSVAGDSIQVHGGIGYTWEHDCHLYFKRAQLDEVLFGDAAWLRSRAVELMVRRQAALVAARAE